MARRSIVFFLTLSPIIPLTAHFAEGFIFVVLFWCFFIAAQGCSMLIKRVNIGKYAYLLPSFCIICAAVLYVQIIGALFPVITVGLEQYLYIAAFSYILTIAIERHDSYRHSLELPVAYTILLTTVSILRELFAFGTLSLPTRSGLCSITLFPCPLTLRFLGSNAGILILLGIALQLFRSIDKRSFFSLKANTPQ